MYPFYTFLKKSKVLQGKGILPAATEKAWLCDLIDRFEAEVYIFLIFKTWSNGDPDRNLLAVY